MTVFWFVLGPDVRETCTALAGPWRYNTRFTTLRTYLRLVDVMPNIWYVGACSVRPRCLSDEAGIIFPVAIAGPFYIQWIYFTRGLPTYYYIYKSRSVRCGVICLSQRELCSRFIVQYNLSSVQDTQVGGSELMSPPDSRQESMMLQGREATVLCFLARKVKIYISATPEIL